MNGNPNTNQGGLTYIPAISTGALFVNGKRLRDTIQELISQDQFEQSEIDEIKTTIKSALALMSDGMYGKAERILKEVVNNETI
jgi:hypothetical protein